VIRELSSSGPGETAMPCTLRDVARTAGVSTATASRVINEAANVSDHTRSKVLSAISRLKYIPDVHAAELRRGKRGIPRNRRNHDLSSARRATERQTNNFLKLQQTVTRLRLLEEENARLKRLVANLCLDVEMWKRMAQ
jgi:Bacterial regulatory proteins, lacI family